MNKNKLPGLFLALFGLAAAALIFYGALHFYITIKQLSQNNPSLSSPADTLQVLTNNDTLVDYNAMLNQQIADKLNNKKEEELNRKQKLLHYTIGDFIRYIDSLQGAVMSHEEIFLRIKNSVNKTNLACRAALFDIRDAAGIEELNYFLIDDEKKILNTPFQCLGNKEIGTLCLENIKHEALHLEKIILEKNFKQLNL